MENALPVIIGLLILGVIGYGVFHLVVTMNYWSNILGYILRAAKDGEAEAEETPRSLSGMDTLYLPQIAKDFPEFNWNEWRSVIEDAVLDRMEAIEKRDASLVRKYPPVYEEVENILRADDEKIPHYRNTKIHKTVIRRYEKKGGTCVITAESSAQYMRPVKSGKDGGTALKKRQTAFDTELVYIQDIDKAGPSATSWGTVCPRCGAPVKKIGMKRCEYCGAAIEPVNRRVWSIDRIREV